MPGRMRWMLWLLILIAPGCSSCKSCSQDEVSLLQKSSDLNKAGRHISTVQPFFTVVHFETQLEGLMIETGLAMELASDPKLEVLAVPQQKPVKPMPANRMISEVVPKLETNYIKQFKQGGKLQDKLMADLKKMEKNDPDAFKHLQKDYVKAKAGKYWQAMATNIWKNQPVEHNVISVKDGNDFVGVAIMAKQAPDVEWKSGGTLKTLPDTAYIDAMVVNSKPGAVGTHLFQSILEKTKKSWKSKAIQLASIKDAFGFWQKMGFRRIKDDKDGSVYDPESKVDASWPTDADSCIPMRAKLT